MGLITPQWTVPANVRAGSSTRSGGVSTAPWDSLNLGAHVGDDGQRVQENRQRLLQLAELPAMPVWLEQVHGIEVLRLNGDMPAAVRAGAVWTRPAGVGASPGWLTATARRAPGGRRRRRRCSRASPLRMPTSTRCSM